MATGDLGEALDQIKSAASGLEQAKKEKDWIKGARFLKDLNRGIKRLEQLLRQQPGSASPSPPTGGGIATSSTDDQRENEETLKISDFFQNVGEGVVAAQEMLDARSREYLDTKPKMAPPTLFRVPKASAEIHFAFKDTKSKGFNLLIFGANDTRQQQQQHKVSFDIVAAPPPPDMIAAINTPTVRDVFVTSPGERAEISDRLIAFAHRIGENTQRGRHALGLAGETVFPRVLILRSKEFWVLMYPKDLGDDNFALDVAYVYRDPKEPPELHGSWEPKAKMDKRLNTLLRLFMELAEDQAKRLVNG